MRRVAIRQRGFTLVELLVVMTILAFAGSIAALAMPRSGHSARDEAERLAGRIHAAQQQAILEGRPLALRISAQGYAFERREGGVWQDIAETPLAPQSWQADTVVSLRSQSTRIRFDPTGMADALVVELRREEGGATVRADGLGRIDVTQ